MAVAVGGVKFKMCFQFLWYVHWSCEAQENHLELHIWTAHVSRKEIVIIGIIMFLSTLKDYALKKFSVQVR